MGCIGPAALHQPALRAKLRRRWPAPLSALASREIRARLWCALLERQAGRFPALDPVGVPMDPRISPFYRSLGGIPRHPAFGPAIDDERAGFLALRQPLEAVAIEIRHFRHERAEADIREPDAAGDVEMPCL